MIFGMFFHTEPYALLEIMNIKIIKCRKINNHNIIVAEYKQERINMATGWVVLQRKMAETEALASTRQ